MNQWRKPTQAEALLNYVAMMPQVYHCQTERGLLTIGYSGGYTDKESKVTYPKRQTWMGYTQVMLERRASWSKDLPEWHEKAPIVEATIERVQTVEAESPKPLEADWMAYLDGNEASKALGAKLETLGSYEAREAA